MELLACGRPVVGTNIRGIRDIISTDEIGKIVPLHDATKTAEAIEALYLKRLNKDVVKSHAKQYDVAVICEQLRQIYETV